MKRFHLITLFKEACEPYLSASILGRAREKKLISVSYQNPRDFTKTSAKGKFAYKKVDERPYGGGPGMVMMAEPIVKAVEKSLGRVSKLKAQSSRRTAIIWFAPGATPFTNKEADKLLKYDDVVFVCGRYEGIDERAAKILKTLGSLKKYSVGEAVYTGAELPALAMIDAMTRRIPGVLGKDASVEERRLASREVYTRPEVIAWKGKKYRVPKVLLTGHHANIDSWKGTKQGKK